MAVRSQPRDLRHATSPWSGNILGNCAPVEVLVWPRSHSDCDQQGAYTYSIPGAIVVQMCTLVVPPFTT